MKARQVIQWCWAVIIIVATTASVSADDDDDDVPTSLPTMSPIISLAPTASPTIPGSSETGFGFDPKTMLLTLGGVALIAGGSVFALKRRREYYNNSNGILKTSKPHNSQSSAESSETSNYEEKVMLSPLQTPLGIKPKKGENQPESDKSNLQRMNSDSLKEATTMSERLQVLRRDVVHSRRSQELGREALESLQKWEDKVLPPRDSVRTKGPDSYRAQLVKGRKQKDSGLYRPKYSIGGFSFGSGGVQESKAASGRSSGFQWRNPVRAYSGAASNKSWNHKFSFGSRFSSTSRNSDNREAAGQHELELGESFPPHQRGLVALWVVADKLREEFKGQEEEKAIAALQESMDEHITARDFLLVLQDIVGTHNVTTTVEYARTRTSFKALLVQAQSQLLNVLDGEGML